MANSALAGMPAIEYGGRTHCNGRRVDEILQTRARLCVWYVEAEPGGQLSRKPYWGHAIAYDINRGLQVWFDGASSAEEWWVDEGDDWEWETAEQAACSLRVVQLKMQIGGRPIRARLPFRDAKAGASDASAPPSQQVTRTPSPTPAGEREQASALAARGSESPRNASAYLFHKKAKLLGTAFAKGAAVEDIAAPKGQPALARVGMPAPAAERVSTDLPAPEARKRKHGGAEDEEVRHVLWPATQRWPSSDLASIRVTAPKIKKVKTAPEAAPRKMNWHSICTL